MKSTSGTQLRQERIRRKKGDVKPCRLRGRDSTVSKKRFEPKSVLMLKKLDKPGRKPIKQQRLPKKQQEPKERKKDKLLKKQPKNLLLQVRRLSRLSLLLKLFQKFLNQLSFNPNQRRNANQRKKKNPKSTK